MGRRRYAGAGRMRRSGAGQGSAEAALTEVLSLRSDLGVTGVPNGLASAWADQSGSGNTVVQATEANQLFWPEDVPAEGIPSLRGEAASTRWFEKATGLAGLPAGSKPRVYVVARHLVTGSFTSTFFETGPGGGEVGAGIKLGHVAGNTVVVLALGAATRTITYDDSSEDSFKLYDIRINDDDTSDLLINDSVVASAAAAAGGLAEAQDQLVIGALCDHSANLRADLLEIVFALNVSASDHAAYLAYFDGRYPFLGL